LKAGDGDSLFVLKLLVVLGFGHLYTLVDLRVLHFRFESALGLMPIWHTKSARQALESVVQFV
jgi:hypothetical protein